MRYNKLVRDKIPDIIQRKGSTPKIHVANKAEYTEKLREKLREEVEEFLKENDWAELADILEVVYALGEALGRSQSDLTCMRTWKKKQRGAFKQRIILEEA